MSMTTLTSTLQHVDSVMLRSVTPTTFNMITTSQQEEDQAAVLSILTTAAATLETTTAAATTFTTSTPAATTKSTSDYDEESDEEEKDLTNLTWLTELRNQTIAWPNAIHQAALDDDKETSGNSAEHNDGPTIAGDDVDPDKSNTVGVTRSKCGKSKSNKNAGTAAQQQAKRPTPAERYEMFLDKVKHDLSEYSLSASNYQMDTTEKPPFNYSHIIGMSMLENGRVTLQQICSWIEAKFAFFRVRKKWNNSIRHNLSLHHCFRKIDRNKYEKGKGGYWELGVDPKKCDRKRIRNRKSGQTKNKQLLNNSKTTTKNAATIAPTTTTTTTTTTNPATAITSYNFDSNNSVTSVMEPDDIETTGMETTEELLLDELDVQQNIDVSSCSQQQQQQHFFQQQQQQVEDIFIANILTQAVQDDDDNTTTTTTTINAADLNGLATFSSQCNNNMLQQQQQQQQYQLGTIIISASAADVAAATNTFNCLINDNYNSNNKQSEQQQQQQQQQQHNILYTEDDIPSACENVIVSSYLANNANNAAGNLDEFSIDANPQSNKHIMHHHHHNHASTSSTHSSSTTTTTIQIPYSQRPNVIVEPLEQPTGYHAIGTSASLIASNATVGGGIGVGVGVSNNCDYANLVGDNFRPYIDGIEEAFQYLRSIDNSREDILDNLLDISVSDY